jgi:hyperosmotically inducible protein
MKLSFITIAAALIISLAGCERRLATDATLNTTVKNKLATDPTTSGSRISVDTSNGVVTLSGSVPTVAEKSEAERIARTTQGVTGVVNNITVEQGETGAGTAFNDATILANVKSQLVASGIIGTNLDVKNGEVTLTGIVDSAQERSKAEEIARQAAGVKSVNNQLTIKQR